MIICIKYKLNEYEILIDDEDFQLVNELYLQLNKQHNTNLRVKCIKYQNGKRIIDTYLSRFLLNVNDKNIQVDHINNNTLDNRKCNLRFCTNIENSQNRPISKRNTSGFKGVYFDKARKKWASEIKVNKHKIFIGRFKNKIDAAKAYNTFAKMYFGEFAYLNSI